MSRSTWNLWLKFYDDIRVDNPFYGSKLPKQKAFEVFVTNLAKSLKLKAPKFPKGQK